MLNLFFIITSLLAVHAGQQGPGVTHVVGVYQGKTLFIQNPYNPNTRKFCISAIKVNNRKLDLNTRVSAIKLDFKELDMFTPIVIEVTHADSLCSPVLLNPDAIVFHSTFSYKSIAMNDSVLTWTTVGDHPEGLYVLERYEDGLWIETNTVPSKGQFETAEYHYYPELEEGPNKYRVKYQFPNPSQYLYSMEVDFHFYPDPVTFHPVNVKDTLHLSRMASYEIYDGGSKLVLSGSGIAIDVRELPRGDYVIYFDGSDPGLFRKQY